MQHFVIDAGATLTEALHLGCPPEYHPPLIRGFARFGRGRGRPASMVGCSVPGVPRT